MMPRNGVLRWAILAGGALAVLAGTPLSAQIDLDLIRRDPVEMLLDLRRQLDLTRSQVSALREIQRELETMNQPLVREIAAIQREVRGQFAQDTSAGSPRRRGDGSRQPEPSESQLRAARTPMESIRRNNVAAMERVNAMLTEGQKKRASVLLRIPDRRRDRGPERSRGPN